MKTHAHSPSVDVSLYVTKSPISPSHTPGQQDGTSQSSFGGPSPPLSPVSDDPEKGSVPQLPLSTRRAVITEKDIEKEILESRVEHRLESDKDGGITTQTISRASLHPVKTGRPDLAFVIRNAVTTTPSNQRVLVAACGPNSLMHVVRDITAGLIKTDGPGVELHCEQFGW